METALPAAAEEVRGVEDLECGEAEEMPEVIMLCVMVGMRSVRRRAAEDTAKLWLIIPSSAPNVIE